MTSRIFRLAKTGLESTVNVVNNPFAHVISCCTYRGYVVENGKVDKTRTACMEGQGLNTLAYLIFTSREFPFLVIRSSEDYRKV